MGSKSLDRIVRFITRVVPALVLVPWTGVQAQAAGRAGVLDSLIAAHRRPVALEGERLVGDGARWLLEQTRDAQFVMIGESHNVAEIPRFTAALLDTLHALSGFGYLALENGPVAMRMIGAAAASGGGEAAFAFGRQYVNALQFWNDEEASAIASVVAAHGGASVWGLDQEWGVQHVLERVREHASTEAVRGLVDEVLARVVPLESKRPSGGERYINSAAAVSDLAAIRAAFGAAPEREVADLLNTVDLSLRIYGMRRGRVGVYESNDLREQSMKAEFMRRYRAAQAAGDSVPKVMLKFGQWHALKGSNWGDVHSLGNFVSEFARVNGRESFHLTAYVLNEPGRFWTLSDFEDYVPLARAGRVDGWTLIDLRPLRPWVAAERVDGVSAELKRVIFGFDAVLLIGGGSPGTVERLTR
jgi:hypothetical protein